MAQERSLSELRTIRATKADENITIDGRLDDKTWLNADWQGNFIQIKPSPGEPARAETRLSPKLALGSKPASQARWQAIEK